MISYQKLFDLMAAQGYTSYKVRQEKLIGQGTLTRLRNGTGGIDAKTLDKLCSVFNCQPGDLMEYMPDKESANE